MRAGFLSIANLFVESPGRYGVIDKKEHATWFIKNLAAGESINLTYEVQADYCLPEQYVAVGEVVYKVTGSSVMPPTNSEI